MALGVVGGLLFTGATLFQTSSATLNEQIALFINSLGQVGIGTKTPTAELEVAGTVKAKAFYLTDPSGVDSQTVQSRVSGTCAAGQSIRTIKADGSVVCETDDYSGGNFATTPPSKPQVGDYYLNQHDLLFVYTGVYWAKVGQLSKANVPLTALVAGWSHTCALTTEGKVQCWGSGEDGQLGNGETSDQTTPVLVLGIKGGGSILQRPRTWRILGNKARREVVNVELGKGVN